MNNQLTIHEYCFGSESTEHVRKTETGNKRKDI